MGNRLIFYAMGVSEIRENQDSSRERIAEDRDTASEFIQAGKQRNGYSSFLHANMQVI